MNAGDTITNGTETLVLTHLDATGALLSNGYSITLSDLESNWKHVAEVKPEQTITQIATSNFNEASNGVE